MSPDGRIELLDKEANYLGDAKVLKLGAPATAEIIRAKEEIFVGDRLIQARDDIKRTLASIHLIVKLQVKVILIYGGIAKTGGNSGVVINLGGK